MVNTTADATAGAGDEGLRPAKKSSCHRSLDLCCVRFGGAGSHEPSLPMRCGARRATVPTTTVSLERLTGALDKVTGFSRFSARSQGRECPHPEPRQEEITLEIKQHVVWVECTRGAPGGATG